jgi:methylmalonyl-CoA mutase C-terminal domain/subunit
MEAGMEVIYTGLRQTPEMIVQTALQEGVDIIGLSILSGAHNELCLRILRLLSQKGLGNVAVIVGGIVPREDIPILQEMGVKGVFGPGANTESVVEFVRTLVATA